MIVIANRQLRGVYGTLNPETSKDLDDTLAKQLLNLGLVRLPPVDESEPVKPVTPVIETPKTPVLETKPDVVPVKSGVTFETPAPEIETKSEGK